MRPKKILPCSRKRACSRRLRHPNVVTVYGVDRHDGRSGVWMDFIEGDTLAALVEQRGSFGAQEALLVGVDVCRALAAAHQSGLLHRDIKAQNVMRESGGRIVLMDFGLGHETARGEPADFGGTPLYMAPEVFEGEPATVRSDLYAVGVLLFHLVTRSYPVEGSTLDELREAQARCRRSAIAARPSVPTCHPHFRAPWKRPWRTTPSRRYGYRRPMTAALEARCRKDRAPHQPQGILVVGASPLAASGTGVAWYLAASRVIVGCGRAHRCCFPKSRIITGDAQLDAVADVLRVQLAQSAHFNLLDGDRVRRRSSR